MIRFSSIFPTFSRPGGPVLEPWDTVAQTFFCLCKSINTPTSLGAWLRFRSGEYLQLVNMEVRPELYDSPSEFQKDYLVVEYLSKSDFLKTGLVLRDEGVQRFKTAEEQCAETNARLKGYAAGRNQPSADVESVISTAHRKIANLLGRAEPTSALHYCRWGPGSTASLTARDAHLANKLLEKRLSVSRLAAPLLRAVMGHDPHWLRARGIEVDGPCSLLSSEFHITDVAKVTTVPKNSKTDRTIGVEPTGNIFLQLGAGRLLRRLLRLGAQVNLNSQGRNQYLAALASKSGHLATIDLKMASDSVSRELVYLLLPLDWADFLDRLRTPAYKLGDGVCRYHKWSAMGNGYTFELESLIFWALASSTSSVLGAEGEISVYGDDVIVPTECVDLLCRTLDFLGFETNRKKTHFASQFRESCGKHFFNGYDVTPIYQKELPSDELATIRFVNRWSRLIYPMPREYHSHEWRYGNRPSESSEGAWNLLSRTLLVKTRTVWSAPWLPELLPVWQTALRGTKTSSQQPLYVEGDFGLRLPENALNRVFVPGGYLLKSLWSVGRKVDASNDALLAYTMRYGTVTPFNGRVACRGVTRVRRKLRYYAFRDEDSYEIAALRL